MSELYEKSLQKLELDQVLSLLAECAGSAEGKSACLRIRPSSDLDIVQELLGETTICENREEGSFIWENYFDEEEQINEYDLTLFIREESGLFRKYQETHYQRGYELETIERLLQEAGMEFVTAYDAFTREAPREDSERIYVIAREQGK